MDNTLPNQKARLRRAMFTWNNYPPDHVEIIERHLVPICRYVTYGREVGKEKGTPHLQGYCEFYQPQRIVHLRKHLPFDYREANFPKSACGYTFKGTEDCPEGGGLKFFLNRSPTWDGKEYGTMRRQGERTDLKPLIEACCDLSKKAAQIQTEHPDLYFKFSNKVQHFRWLNSPKRYLTQPTEIIVLVGSVNNCLHVVRQQLTDDDVFYKRPTAGWWWDGYDRHKTVVWEFEPNECRLNVLLAVIGDHQCQLPVKGGFVQMLADKFVFVSKYHPEEWFPRDREFEAIFNENIIQEITPDFFLQK